MSQANKIMTRSKYDDTERFRLWVTLSEDIRKTGTSYRSYHSRMIDALDVATKKGAEFVNPNGSKLNLQMLSQDDLYGFLGRAKDQPNGPGRKIADTKVRIIHAYLAYTFPTIISILSDREAIHSIAMSNSHFLNGFQKPDEIKNFAAKAKRVKGIYVSIFGEESTIKTFGHYEPMNGPGHATVIAVDYVEGCLYLDLTMFFIDLNSNDIDPKSELFKCAKWNYRSPASKFVYRGAAVPLQSTIVSIMPATAIMVEKMTGRSISENIQFSIPTERYEKEYVNLVHGKQKYYNLIGNNKILDRHIFMDCFIEKLYKRAQTIGLKL